MQDLQVVVVVEVVMEPYYLSWSNWPLYPSEEG